MKALVLRDRRPQLGAEKKRRRAHAGGEQPVDLAACGGSVSHLKGELPHGADLTRGEQHDPLGMKRRNELRGRPQRPAQRDDPLHLCADALGGETACRNERAHELEATIASIAFEKWSTASE